VALFSSNFQIPPGIGTHKIPIDMEVADTVIGKLEAKLKFLIRIYLLMERVQESRMWLKGCRILKKMGLSRSGIFNRWC
jgi:hypothetical protein